MLITRETDYALRILRALAGGEQLTAGELADGEQVPQQFAYKILKKLQKGHLVDIQRGASGGCSLSADLRNVSLFDLIQVMEADNYVAPCMEPEHQCLWRLARGGIVCHAHVHLSEIQRTLNAELKAHSLQKILFDP